MDLLQRLSFWQTNNNVRMKTTAAENEETIIEINQEDGENKKETKTNIITTEPVQPRIINVSIDIYLKHTFLYLCYINCVLFIFTSTITSVSQVGTHDPRYKVHQLFLLCSIIYLHVLLPFLFARDV